MREIGKILTHREGFSPSDRYLRKDGQPAVKPGIETGFDFLHLTTPTGGELHLGPTTSENGIEIRAEQKVEIHTQDPLLALPLFTAEYATTTTIGEEPGHPISYEFGTSEQTIQITALGHPMRGILDPMTESSHEPITFDTQRGEGRMLFHSAPVQARIHDTNLFESSQTKTPSKVHEGKLIVGAYVRAGRPSELGAVKVFAGVKSTEDELWRVRHSEKSAYPHTGRYDNPYNNSRLVDGLADLSTFSAFMDREGYASIREMFPFAFIDSLGADLHWRASEGTGINFSDLTKNHGVDWQAIRTQLPSELVTSEVARISKIFGVQYERPRIEVPEHKSVKRRRGSFGQM